MCSISGELRFFASFRLFSPEQIRTERDESVRSIPIADPAQVLIDAENFLQDDNARTVTAGRQSKVGGKLSAIKGFQSNHRLDDLRAKLYTRSVRNWRVRKADCLHRYRFFLSHSRPAGHSSRKLHIRQ